MRIALANLIRDTEERHGPIDVFFSNAGAGAGGGAEASNDAWQSQWELHVMAHVYAARAVLPSMIASGEGYLVHTASAAGLLMAVGSAPYSVTKAGCIKLAEYLAITHGDEGIRVSVLCPQGVNTAMAPQQLGDGATDGIVEATFVADKVVEAMGEERFFILPHPEVATYMERKADQPGPLARRHAQTPPPLHRRVKRAATVCPPGARSGVCEADPNLARPTASKRAIRRSEPAERCAKGAPCPTSSPSGT